MKMFNSTPMTRRNENDEVIEIFNKQSTFLKALMVFAFFQYVVFLIMF